MKDSRFEYIALVEKHGGAAALLDWMTWEMKANNALVIPKDIFAKAYGISIRALERRLKVLDEFNFIDLSIRHGLYTIYINSKFAKVGDVFCKFTATVILTEDDVAKKKTQLVLSESRYSGHINKGA
jgi:Firmicute plasmid replication protein (RepL)